MSDLLKKIFFYLLFVIIFNNCDDSTAPVDTKQKFLPLEQGNYWIYSTYELDMYFNPIQSTMNDDSIVIVSSKNILNLTAYLFVRYRNSIPIDTLYFTSDEEFIYQLCDSNITFIPSLKDKWFPIISLKLNLNQSWNIFSQQFNNYPLLINDKKYFGEYMHTINGTIEYSDSINFNSKKELTKNATSKYDSRLLVEMTDTIKSPSGYEIRTSTYTRLHKYFDRYTLLEGVGFYSIRRDPHTLSFSTQPSSSISGSQNYNGTEMILKQFKVK